MDTIIDHAQEAKFTALFQRMGVQWVWIVKRDHSSEVDLLGLAAFAIRLH